MPQFDETFELHAGTKPMSQGAPAPRLDVQHTVHDWHNDYAEFMLELASKIEKSDQAGRYDLMKRLKETLAAGSN